MQLACRRLLLLAPLLLLGCGAMPAADRVDVMPDRGLVARAAEEAPPGASRAAHVVDPALSLQEGPGSYIYSHEPGRLGEEVARACEGARRLADRDALRALVADLYFSGVHPAAATEALLDGGCGTLSDIVEEMVAQGGRESLDAVVARARLVAGARAGRQIDSAAAVGLARRARVSDAESGRPQAELPAYGMLYFPSQGESSKLVTSVALNRLYEDAVPGYGIYTFVVSGRGLTSPKDDDAARYGELFRMIETYVSSVGAGEGGPSAEAHVFVVPVNPEKMGAPLADQAVTDLSDVMRRHLIQVLRHEGRRTLASRLDTGAGPFLVATLQPSLLPSSADTPWLVTDLSGLGPEYVYDVVDAFDRAIPIGISGRPESLAVIRQRLLDLPVKTTEGPEAKADARAWIFMLGDFA